MERVGEEPERSQGQMFWSILGAAGPQQQPTNVARAGRRGKLVQGQGGNPGQDLRQGRFSAVEQRPGSGRYSLAKLPTSAGRPGCRPMGLSHSILAEEMASANSSCRCWASQTCNTDQQPWTLGSHAPQSPQALTMRRMSRSEELEIVGAVRKSSRNPQAPIDDKLPILSPSSESTTSARKARGS